MSEHVTRDFSEHLPPGEALPVYVIARALGCHRSDIVHLVEAGEVEAIDLRGPGSSRSTIRVTRQSLMEWLESRSVIATTGKLNRRGGKHTRKN